MFITRRQKRRETKIGFWRTNKYNYCSFVMHDRIKAKIVIKLQLEKKNNNNRQKKWWKKCFYFAFASEQVIWEKKEKTKQKFYQPAYPDIMPPLLNTVLCSPLCLCLSLSLGPGLSTQYPFFILILLYTKFMVDIEAVKRRKRQKSYVIVKQWKRQAKQHL